MEFYGIVRHIFLPQDRKTIKKTAKSFSPLTAVHSRRFLSATVTRGIERFHLPSIPTANQILWHCSNSQLNKRCGQNLAAAAKISGPLLARPRKRECMRTAKIGPDLSVTTGNGRHTV